jgi:Ni,Fe-hydrogenase III large subunit
MDAARPLVLVSTRESAPCDLEAWAADCARALDAGERVVTLFGRPAEGDAVVTTAVLQDDAGGLRVLRGRGMRGTPYPSLTARHAAVQMFERELWEQHELIPAGHPWLKRVRYEGTRQTRMDEHPFYVMHGREVHEVGVGPIHASVIEPGHFRFMCHGERVHHLEIQLGYQHRNVEALLLRRPAAALGSLVESIAGDTSIAYAWAWCAALEALAGTRTATAAGLARGVALEMERIGMHLVALTGLATDIAFLQAGASYGRLRTAIINATMRCCGSRFGRGWLRPGGVRAGIDTALRDDLHATLTAFAKDVAEVNDLMQGARSVRSRFQGIGIVTTQAASEIGMVGLAARASGIARDTRADLPGRLYRDHPVTALTEDGGDCWARMKLRMREIDASLEWIFKALADPALLPGADALVQPLPSLAPETLCVSIREGFRGPVVHALETDGDGKLLHYKVQDPSLPNWFGLALALRNNEISDFPICNKSFDLSYCGSDL